MEWNFIKLKIKKNMTLLQKKNLKLINFKFLLFEIFTWFTFFITKNNTIIDEICLKNKFASLFIYKHKNKLNHVSNKNYLFLVLLI